MIGSGGGVPPAMMTGAGLAELAALVEVTKDPAKYEAMLAELTTRASSLDTREQRLDQRKEQLDKQEKAQQLRELDMLKCLETVANERAADRVKADRAEIAEARTQLEKQQAKLRQAVEAIGTAARRLQDLHDQMQAAWTAMSEMHVGLKAWSSALSRASDQAQKVREAHQAQAELIGRAVAHIEQWRRAA